MNQCEYLRRRVYLRTKILEYKAVLSETGAEPRTVLARAVRVHRTVRSAVQASLRHMNFSHEFSRYVRPQQQPGGRLFVPRRP